jgi:hypothetical protein
MPKLNIKQPIKEKNRQSKRQTTPIHQQSQTPLQNRKTKLQSLHCKHKNKDQKHQTTPTSKTTQNQIQNPPKISKRKNLNPKQFCPPKPCKKE